MAVRPHAPLVPMEHAPFRRRALDHLIRPTRAEIDLGALTHNLDVVRKLAAPAGVLAVIKANAYGHGAVPVARALERAGVDMLAVALVEEGIELRTGGVKAPILVLGGAYDGGYGALLEADLTPVVFRADHLETLAGLADERGQRVRVHLKVDTGMSRIGVLPEDLDALLALMRRLPQLELDGLLSHFASADVQGAASPQAQIDAFLDAHRRVLEAGFAPRWRHLSNSAAVLGAGRRSEDAPAPVLARSLHQGLFNLVRPGLALYGHAPAGWLDGEPLRPVLTWKTGVIHLKTVPAGTAVSYGGTWVSERETRLATLPVGYADGYPRSFSSRAHVVIRGQRAPIVGRVCMDMCLVDVTDVPEVALHDEVVLLGEQGGAQVTLEELAALADTIPYEITCGIGARVPRLAV